MALRVKGERLFRVTLLRQGPGVAVTVWGYDADAAREKAQATLGDKAGDRWEVEPVKQLVADRQREVEKGGDIWWWVADGEAAVGTLLARCLDGKLLRVEVVPMGAPAQVELVDVRHLLTDDEVEVAAAERDLPCCLYHETGGSPCDTCNDNVFEPADEPAK